MRGEARSTTENRIRSKIEVTPSGCWQWLGAKQPAGYGTLWNGVRPEQAHRVSYRHFRCEIPQGFDIDHLCRNRSCVNPDHLRAVPHRENMRVSDTPMGRNAAKLFCKRGHAFEGDNLRIIKGARQCRACMNIRAAAARQRRRARG